MNKLLDLLRRKHRPDTGALSAQLDGQLDADADARLSAHIATCEACREQYDALAAARAALRAMPQAEVPRSFRISEAQLPDRVPARPSYGTALKFAGAAAAVIAVLVVGLQVFSNSGTSPSADRAPLAQQAPEKSLSTTGSDAATSPAAPAAGAAVAPSPATGGIAAADSAASPEGTPANAPAFSTGSSSPTPPAPAPESARNSARTPAEVNPPAVNPEPSSGGGNKAASPIVWIAAAVVLAVPVTAIAWRLRRRGRTS